MLAFPALIAFFSVILLIMILIPIARKIGFTDCPNHRKQHKKPTPMIGGVAIYMATALALLVTGEHIPCQTAYLSAGLILVAVGMVDDYRGLGVKIRMLAQICAGLIMIECGELKITGLGDLFGLGNLYLGEVSGLFTLFALVGGINALNMVDGLDGLAGSLALASMCALTLAAWLAQDLSLLSFCSICIACLVGFLIFNLRLFNRDNASIFLGDSGSTLLGFTIGWIAIAASQSTQTILSPVSVLWIIAIPLFDSICIMVRRMKRGRSPFMADREHLHHFMLLKGYGVNQIVMRLFGYALFLGTSAVISDQILEVSESVLFLCFLFLFVAHVLGMNYAWTLLKIKRYIMSQNHFPQYEDRRKQDRREVEEWLFEFQNRRYYSRRKVTDRRYKPTKQQLDRFMKTLASNYTLNNNLSLSSPNTEYQ